MHLRFLFSLVFLTASVSCLAQTTYLISPNPATVNENAGTLTFTITRSGSTPAETIYASTTTTEGFANNGDYVGILNQTVSFTSGQASRTVTVTINNDSTVESSETFGFLAQRNSFDPVSTYLAKSTFTITDVPQPADLVPLNLSVNPNPVTVGGSVTLSYIIRNQGGSSAPPSQTKIQIKNGSGALLTQQIFSTSAIGAGSSVSEYRSISLSGATAGTHYAVMMVDNFSQVAQSNTANDLSSPYYFSVTGASPANDTCAGAIAMIAGTAYFMNTASATSTGDPTPSCGGSFGKGVWFTFTPSTNGTVTISTCGSDYNTVLQVYTADIFFGCSSLTAVTCNDDSGPSCLTDRASVSFTGTAGTAYRILVGGFAGSAGNLSIVATQPQPPPPVNDQCSGAISMTAGSPYSMSTVNATGMGDSTPSCGGNFGKGVWFKFTPAVNGLITVNTCGSGFDTMLQLYAGSCGSLSPIACDDDNGPACGGLQASAAFIGTASTTYYFLAGGYGGSSGNLQITASVVATPPPPNDLCASAITLTAGSNYRMDTSPATSSQDPTPKCASSFGKGVWFKFTPPITGQVAVSTCGSDFDTVLQVYTGSCGSLVPVIAGCDDDGSSCPGTNASVRFEGSTGKDYYILVGGYNNTGGNLNVIANVELPNDECFGAIPLPAGTTIVLDTTAASSQNDPVPTCQTNHFGKGVWFTFIPSISGEATISTCGSDFDTVLQVYAGSCNSPPLPDGCNDDFGPACPQTRQASVAFHCSAGANYYVLAGGHDGEAGTLRITANAVPLIQTNTHLPNALPPLTGCLNISLDPESGQWRFVGEVVWRDQGLVCGLAAGNYLVEFRRVQGYYDQINGIVSVAEAQTNQATFSYALNEVTNTGRLTVTISPADVANAGDVTNRGQWRLEGEIGWHDSGWTNYSVPVGIQSVEFKRVPNLAEPQDLAVLVSTGAETKTNGIYYSIPPGSVVASPRALNFNEVTDTNWPYLYNGQILTDLGLSSGAVVKERVVLTAAHALFDDQTLTWATNILWFFHKHAGYYQPASQVPRGTYKLSGYAAQRTTDIRTNDVSPGISTLESQELDAAVLYFTEIILGQNTLAANKPGRSGYGGYLSSDAGPHNEYLTGNNNKMLVGYPLERLAETNWGKMHASIPTNLHFGPISDTNSNVFRTTDIKTYPGNSGGPLYVQWTNGVYYPAAICLGGADEIRVRAIDSGIADLIKRAEASGNGGANSTGGGVVLISVRYTPGAFGTGYVQVVLEPPAAVANGAAWRVKDGPYPFTNDPTEQRPLFLLAHLLARGSFTIEFQDVPGWGLPAYAELENVSKDEAIHLSALYHEPMPALTYRLYEGLRLFGAAGLAYRIESTANVNLTPPWQLVTNVLLKTNSQLILGTQPTNSGNRFFRAAREQ